MRRLPPADAKNLRASAQASASKQLLDPAGRLAGRPVCKRTSRNVWAFGAFSLILQARGGRRRSARRREVRPLEGKEGLLGRITRKDLQRSTRRDQGEDMSVSSATAASRRRGKRGKRGVGARRSGRSRQPRTSRGRRYRSCSPAQYSEDEGGSGRAGHRQEREDGPSTGWKGERG